MFDNQLGGFLPPHGSSQNTNWSQKNQCSFQKSFSCQGKFFDSDYVSLKKAKLWTIQHDGPKVSLFIDCNLGWKCNQVYISQSFSRKKLNSHKLNLNILNILILIISIINMNIFLNLCQWYWIIVCLK